jgi:hypothetical protein
MPYIATLKVQRYKNINTLKILSQFLTRKERSTNIHAARQCRQQESYAKNIGTGHVPGSNILSKI